MGVAQLYLMTSDLDATASFCRDVLELDVRERGERSITVDAGPFELKYEADFDEETLAAFGLDPPGEDRGEGAIVVVETDDVERIYRNATEAGAETLMEPREVDWGREMFLVRDPDGYTYEVSRELPE